MGIFLFCAVFVAVAVAGWLLYGRHKAARLAAQNRLVAIAELLAGKVRRSRRDASLGSVEFEYAGHCFTLYREEKLSGNSSIPCCVIEASADCYAGPHVEILRREGAGDRLLSDTPEAAVDDVEFAERFVVYAQQEPTEWANQALADPETRRFISYALDRKNARLHLSPKGVWFECAGFPDNVELVTALARTGAKALARFCHTPDSDPR